MKRLATAIVIICSAFNIAWVSPRTSNALRASQDVLASSSDTHAVGSSSNRWENGYFNYMRLHHYAPSSTNVASFGYLYVSTDKSLNYRDEDGTNTVVVAAP